MTIFRNIKTSRLCYLYYVISHTHTGRWYETEDMYTGERQVIKHNYEDVLIPVAYR